MAQDGFITIGPTLNRLLPVSLRLLLLIRLFTSSAVNQLTSKVAVAGRVMGKSSPWAIILLDKTVGEMSLLLLNRLYSTGNRFGLDVASTLLHSINQNTCQSHQWK